MEKYQGVKFRNQQVKSSFSYDDRLDQLNRWAYLFSQIGLAPVHSEGAYGNHSYRTGNTSFVITKSAMIPSEILKPVDFCPLQLLMPRLPPLLQKGRLSPPQRVFFIMNCTRHCRRSMPFFTAIARCLTFTLRHSIFL